MKSQSRGTLRSTATMASRKSTATNATNNFAMINGARNPPRPTPSMVNYSDEDSAKGYDENPDDSDSLTEKPSEISSTDSQVSFFTAYMYGSLGLETPKILRTLSVSIIII